eukprot:14960771-Ditylum_brightwellii.AAC.1
MGLWANTLAYQLLLATGLSGLMQKEDNVPNNQEFEAYEDGLLPVVALLEDCNDNEAFISNIAWQLDYIKNSNVATWLKDCPELVDLDAAVSPRVSKSLHAAACMQSGASIQDASVATLSTSPDDRVACHKIWDAVLVTSGTTLCIVMPVVALDFKDIMQASGSKNDCAWMFTESLSNFYEEVEQNT